MEATHLLIPISDFEKRIKKICSKHVISNDEVVEINKLQHLIDFYYDSYPAKRKEITACNGVLFLTTLFSIILAFIFFCLWIVS